MFLLRSIAQRIIRRPLQLICVVIAVAIVVGTTLVTASVALSASRAQQAYLGCLNGTAADLVAVPARASEEERQGQEFWWGDRPDGVIIDGMRRVSQYETMTPDGGSMFCLESLGMPIEAAGALSQQDLETISAVPGVDRVAGTLSACYSISTETWSAEVLENLPEPIVIDDEDRAALEARLARDTEYASYLSEVRELTSKDEADLTAADRSRIDELFSAMSLRKETLYHQWRPDLFPEPTTEGTQGVAEPVCCGRESIICGTPPDAGFVAQFSATEGRALNDDDTGTRVAFLRDDYAALRGLRPGDTVTFVDVSYTVVGIGSSALGASAPEVFVPLAALQEDIQASGKYNTLFIDTAPGADVEQVRAEIAEAIPGLVVSDATDLSKVLAPSVTGVARIISQFGTALTTVLLVTSALLLVTFTTSEVAKRAQEIATLRAIGWSHRKLMVLLVTENTALVLFGAALGIAGGLVIIYQLAGQSASEASASYLISTGVLQQLAGTLPLGSTGTPVVTTVSWPALALTLGAAVLMAIASTIAVTRAMARVSPARALAQK